MAVYRVINKHHTRATIQEQHAVDNRGNPYVLVNAGVPIRYEVGALLEDLTPAELEAFPDRFQLLDDQLRPVGQPMPPARMINPELFALLARAHAGDATADEQALVGLFVPYLARHAAGPVPSTDTTALEEALQEFQLPLFV